MCVCARAIKCVRKTKNLPNYTNNNHSFIHIIILEYSHYNNNNNKYNKVALMVVELWRKHIFINAEIKEHVSI